ncbi:MAG: T9SS type A sorting domain-containing protein [Lewinella sp.]
MRAFLFIFFPISLLSGMLNAQDQNLTYTMKLTRVYSDFPINQDANGPDLRYRIRGRLTGLGGAEVPASVDVYLENNQQIGWIDIPDEVIATGSITPDGPAIDLCQTGIGVIMDELQAWESDNGNGAISVGSDDARALLTNPYPIGAPERNATGSGISGSFQIRTSAFIPGSHFGYEFEVTYVLENGIREVIIAGNAQGDPVTSVCEGGTVYLAAKVGPRFEGGNYRYEQSSDGGNTWTFIAQGTSSVPTVSVPIDLNNQYRASLGFCLQGDGEKLADLSALTVLESIAFNDIITRSTSLCEGGDNGTITVEDIQGIPPETVIELQLDKRVFSPGQNANPTIRTTVGELPVTFENLSGGNYVIIASLLTFVDGNEVPSCSVNSATINLAPAPSPASFTAIPNSPLCIGTAGTISVNYSGTEAYTAALYTPANVLVVAPVSVNAGQEHVFADVAPGSYYVQIANGGGCTRDSDPIFIAMPTTTAGGTFMPLDGSFNIDCPEEEATFVFTPTPGTGENEISLTRIASGQRIPIFTDEFVSPGGDYTRSIRGGDYELTFKRVENGCVNTQLFTVTSNQLPVSINLLNASQPTACMPTSGSLTAVVSGGTQPYTIEIVGQSITPATVTPVGNTVQYVYNTVPGGNNLIRITDANGCVEELPLAVPVAAGVSLAIDNAASDLSLTCNGDSDGRVQFTGQGVGALQYRIVELNNAYSAQSFYDNLPGGLYTGMMRDANGCEASTRFEVVAPISPEILSVEIVPLSSCLTPALYDVTLRVATPTNTLNCVNGVLGDMTLAQDGRLVYSFDGGLTQEAIITMLGSNNGNHIIEGSLCDGVFDITFRNLQSNNYGFRFEMRNGIVAPFQENYSCLSSVVNLTPADFVPLPIPTIEIIGQTNPSCPGAFDGSLTARLSGSIPGVDYTLLLAAGERTGQNSHLPVSNDPLPRVIDFNFTNDTTITMTGLADLQDVYNNPSAYYYFSLVYQDPLNPPCGVYTSPPNPPLADQTRLTAPPPLGFSFGFDKYFECDGSGGIINITAPSGGTPPYQFKLIGYDVGEPEETLQDFSDATTFNVTHKDRFYATMRDAMGCTVNSSGGGTLIGIYDPSFFIYNMVFTPDPIVGCPPEPGELLGGELRLSGGLGETTYRFVNNSGADIRPPLTSSDSVIRVTGLVPGPFIILPQNTATGVDCRWDYGFNYPAPPLPLTATTTLNQGESCLGSADGEVRIRASGGRAPITFINRGVQTVFPSWQVPELVITDVTSGLRTVLIFDANGCQLVHQVEVAPSPGNITINIATDPPNTCLGADDGTLTISPQGGTGPYQLTWMDDDGFTVSIPAGGSTTRNDLNRQEYPLEIVDANGCSNTFSPLPGGRDQLEAQIVNVVQPGCNTTGSFRVEITQNSFPASTMFFYRLEGGVLQTNPNFTGLDAGTYSVTVLDDNNCPQANELTVTLTNSNSLTLDATPTVTGCNGQISGQIVAIANNGTPPYQYSLNGALPVNDGTFTGLATGTYNIVATDAAGCTATSGPITLADPVLVEGSVASSMNSCAGSSTGSVTLASTSGFAPFTYRLAGGAYGPDPVFTGLDAGDYQFQVRDANGCESDLITATVSAFPLFTVAQGAIQDASCDVPDGSSTVGVVGGNDGYSFAWPDGQTTPTVTTLRPGSYEVTITNNSNGCSQNFVTSVGTLPPFVIEQNSSQSAGCNTANGNVTVGVVGGSDGYTFAWADGQTGRTATGLAPGNYEVTVTSNVGCSQIFTATVEAADDPSLNTLRADDEICDGGNGRITVQGVGGTPPYTYNWSDEPARTVTFVDTLSSGSYTVTVTDAAGCTAQTTIVLGNTPGITVSLVINAPDTCGQNLGSATVTTTGGIEPITYAWSHDPTADGPMVNNLPGSISSVTVTSANGCTDELTISTSSVQGIVATNGSPTPTSCGLDNGTITSTPVGGTAPFSYTWSHTDTLTNNPATDLAPGGYSVTITDANGCDIERTYTVDPSTNNLSLAITDQFPSGCANANGQIIVEPVGNVNSVNYSWSHDPDLNGNSAFSLAAGNYSVTATELGSGCTAVLNYTIEGSPGGATVRQSTLTNTSCGLDNGVLEVAPDNGNAPFTYQWSHTDTLTIGTATNLAAGDYSVTATDADGCISEGTFTINSSILPQVILLNFNPSADCGQANGTIEIIGTFLPNPSYNWSHDPNLNSPLAENLAGGDYSVTVTSPNGCSAEGTFTVENNGLLSVTADRTNSLCVDGNGAVSVTVAGGTPPYTYDWEHAPGENVAGFIDLNTGFYQVTVTDATGCTGQAFAVVNVIEPPTLTVFTQVHTSCGQDNGFLYVNASGGLRPYVFNWAEVANQTTGQTNGFDDIFDLAAGDYNLTVTDANGCMVSGTYTIDDSEPVALTAANQTNPSGGMNNGSITIATTGFVAPLTYSWSHDGNLNGPTAANLPAGIYTISVQDVNFCYDEVTVVLSSGLIAELINVNNPVCTDNTGTAEVNVLTGTAPYSYAWSHAPGIDVPSFDNLSGGDYTVQVSDATGATFDLIFELEFEGGFSEIFSFSTPASCGLDNGFLEIFPENGEFPFTYNWADFPGLNENRLTDLAIGDYAVTVTDGQGCSLSRVFTVAPAPAPELIIDYLFQPTDGMADGEVGVVTSGFTEPITYSWSHDPNINSPFLEDIPAGTYTLTVTDDLGCTEMITIEVGVPIVVAQAINLRDAGCTNDDGEATILVTVGQFPYSYEWSHAPGQNVSSFDNLAGGDYMVTVGDDAGAMTVVSFSIDFLSGPTAIVATANEGTSCGESNAVLTVAPVGGNAPFEYEWVGFPGISGPTLTDLPPGDYTLSIFDNQNCSFTETFTVAGSAVPAVSLDEQVNPTGGLANGSISITTTGFTAPLTYQWSHDNNINAPLAENLTAGSYTVSVSDDNGCNDELTVVLTEGLIAEIINLSNSVCTDDNGTAEVNVLSGTAPFNYEWSHAPGINVASFSDLARGNYTVTVTDANGATFGLDFFVGLELGPTAITATTNQEATCGVDNGTLTVSPTGGTAPYTYGWENFPDIDGPSLTDLAPGDYSVTITDANGCSFPEAFTIGSSAGPTAITATTNQGTICGENNGVLTVSPTGGTAPFIYAWADFPVNNSPSLTDLAPNDYALTVTDANGCMVTETFTIDGSDLPLVSLDNRTDPDAGMDNGSISVTTSGMTAPLIYTWSHDANLNAPLATGLANGTYTVTVTDVNGCTDELTVVLDGPDPIVAEITDLADAVCTDDNGTATVNVITGIAPFSYAWSHAPGEDMAGFTDLASGNYSVTVSDAAGVDLELTFTVSFIDGPTAIVATTQLSTICGLDNGLLEVAGQGGTEPLTYAWSHDPEIDGTEARDLAPGDYTVTVTDVNGCTTMETFTIGASDVPAITIVNQFDPTCGETNGSIELSSTGLAEPIIALWSHDPGLSEPTATNLAAGTYEVTLTGNLGCDASISISLAAQEALTTTLSNVGDAICDDGTGSASIEVASGTAPYSYSWSHAPGENQANFDDLVAGDYSVTTTDANGCFDIQTFSIGFITGPTGIETTQYLATICGLDNGLLDLSPQGGNGPYSFAWSHDAELEGSEARDLAPGDYIATITDANGCTISETYTIGESEIPTAEIVDRSEASCEQANGLLEVATANLSAPLTYAWSHDGSLDAPRAENLSSGNYRVTITGAQGCTAEAQASISSLDGPSISVSSVESNTCTAADGSVTISYDGGGVAPFSYTWSHDSELNDPQANNLVAGTYGVTITDATGCRDALLATVEAEFTTLLSNLSTAPASCAQNDGTATATLNSGVAPYTYAWSHDASLSGAEATNLPAGDHTLTITDANGCFVTEAFTILTTEGPSEVSTVLQLSTICGLDNGILQVAAVGGTAPYTYAWSHDGTLTGDEASDLPSGDYTVTITDANSCTTSTTLAIGESDVPTASIVAQTDPDCNQNNGSIIITTTGMATPLVYEWDHDGTLNAATAEGLGAGDYEVFITDNNGCTATVSTSLTAGQSLAAAVINLTDTRCEDGNGAATIEVTDGVEPITYVWSHAPGQNVDGFTDLATGDYSVTVSDANGCSKILTFSIGLTTGPTAIEATSLQATACGLQNGSLSVTPTSGTAPFSYAWADFPTLDSGELADLAAGDYALTVTDANGCSVSEEFTVASSETPTASVSSQTDSNCGQSNGSATVSTTGLTGALFFAWSHDADLNAATAEDLAAGDYSVTITGANGCTATGSIVIGNTDGPMISLATVVNVSCGTANGSINTNYEGGGTAPFIYTWSHDTSLNSASAEGLESGTYGVTITDMNGCSDVLSVDLIDLAGPESLTAASLTPTICGEPNGALTVEVAGGTAPFTYSWNHDTTITGDRATELDSGVYRVVVTDANGCTTSNTFSIPSSIGLAITADEVVGANCNMENGSILISVANATGEVTYVWNHNTTLNTPMLTDLPAGNYMVTVTDEAGCSTEGMFMVESLDNPASFTITASPSNCEDGQGSIAVSITDGRPPYSYLWSHDNTLNVPVVSGLTEGDYNVLVTDVLGCQVLLEASVVLTEGPDATVVTTEPGCAGATNGSLTAMPTGGTTPYTYLWSNTAVTASISDAAAGAYSVTITDANGCTTTADAMLIDGPPVVITLLDSIPPSCAELADGRLEVEASGGSAPYSFNWSEGTNAALAEGLSAGVTYSVTVTSAEGCLAEMSYSMPNVLPLSLPIPADTTLCQDDIWALDLTAYTDVLVTSPNGFSSNEPVVLIDEAETYTITATGASGCAGSSEVVVNFTGQTFVAGMVLPSDVVAGDSVVVLETSWPAPNSVEWIFDRSGARQVAQEQNQYWFVFDEVGEYNLSLLASFGGCDDLITKGLTVHADSTSIPSIGLTRSGIEDVVISPNPNNGRFNAEVTLSNVDRVFMNLYDLDGTTINRQEDTGLSNYTFNYDLNLEAGSYLLLVQTGSARRTVVIIVSD